ncbi:MAG: acyl carrier protein [Spirochaetales bacterium]|nr:acyl carrier protein [Spirochaetales bacterium]
MENGDIKKTLADLIRGIRQDETPIGELADDVNLLLDLGLDSIQVISLILAVEDTFGIEIDYDNFEYGNMESVKSFCGFIASSKKKNDWNDKENVVVEKNEEES